MTSLPKDHISHSQINMYKRCAKQYYYRYVEDLVRPPKWIMPAGKAGHQAMEFNNANKMKTGHNESKHDVIGFFEASWKKEIQTYEDINYGSQNPSDVVSAMSKPIGKYFDDGTFVYDVPTGVEKEFALKFDGIETTVIGTIDVEFPGGIYDYKFSQKKPAMQTIVSADQLKMYALSYYIENKKFPKNLGFAYLISTQTPQVNIYELPDIPTFVGDFVDDIKEAIATISSSMKSGIFMRNPTGFMCNPNDCGYWDICKPGQKKIYWDLSDKYPTQKRGAK